LIAHEQLIRSTAQDRIQQRHIARLEFSRPYLEYHDGLPRLFTENEISMLNLTRSAEDQLVLKPTGLLKHHCCFPNCPMYLVNLATINDIKSNQAHGINKHMNPDRYLGYYIKGMHHCAQQFAKKPFTKFEELMTIYISKQPLQLNWFGNSEMKSLWQSYQFVKHS
jgi:hypothetical protein